jgi:nitroreductase
MARRRWHAYVPPMSAHTPAPVNEEIEAFKPLAEILWDRRAIRQFEPEPVPEEHLEKILALASQAPSGYNLQPWRFVVVREPAQRERLRRAAFDQPRVSEAPVVIVAFARREAWDEYADEIFLHAAEAGARRQGGLAKQKAEAMEFISTLPIAVWLNRHVMIAFTYLMLAAESLGWDTAPMEGFDAAAVRDVVGLPGDAEVVALLAIGRQRGARAPHPGRLPVNRIAFNGSYGRPWGAEAT